MSWAAFLEMKRKEIGSTEHRTMPVNALSENVTASAAWQSAAWQSAAWQSATSLGPEPPAFNTEENHG